MAASITSLVGAVWVESPKAGANGYGSHPGSGLLGHFHKDVLHVSCEN